MLPDPAPGRQFRTLLFRLRNACGPTPDLFYRVMNAACSRQKMLARAGKTARLNRLIKTEAWLEAALELTELEHPAWRLRRLVYDDGEWICSLSSMPNLPLFLDPMTEFTHVHPAIAVLGALLELSAVRPSGAVQSMSAVPRVRNAEHHYVRSYALD